MEASYATIKPTIMDEDIVISGMSGRFPESDSTDEFAQNLYNGADMLKVDNRRWPTGMSNLIILASLILLSSISSRICFNSN